MKFQLDMEKQKSLGAARIVLTVLLGDSEFQVSRNLVFIPLLQEQPSISVKT